MQTNILDVLTENVQPSTTEYSFVIDKDQANNIIGNAKETLEDNKFIIKRVKIIIMNKKDFYTFYFYTELIGIIIVTMFLYYIIF